MAKECVEDHGWDCGEICCYECCADPKCNHYYCEHYEKGCGNYMCPCKGFIISARAALKGAS